MYRKAWHISAYTFQADTYCPDCIMAVLPTGDGERYDGWALSAGSLTTEKNLDEIAIAFGIDRYDEKTFDSGDFPKVVLSSQIEDIEYCANCQVEVW